MVVNYIILCVLVFIFLLINTIKIIYKTTGGYETTVEVIGYWVFAILLINFFFCVFIYFNVKSLKGTDGPPGLDGSPGEPGTDGKCLANCGQKVCNSMLVNNINKYFKKKSTSTLNIRNKLILDRINKICFSKNYYGMLISKHDKRPNEKELIEYIEKIFKVWIDLILGNFRGQEFLLNEGAQTKFFGRNKNPFDEIEKYDIWSWGDNYKFKPIVRIQCAKKTNKPSGTTQEIYLFYSNKDYETVFMSNVGKNKYGPLNCPYNQLGEDFTNPRGLTQCYFFDQNNNNYFKKIYLQTQNKPFKKNIAFFNALPVTTENNQQFHPIGTIWRGINKTHRTMNKNYIGPEKFTVLLSGKVSSPIDYLLIWSSTGNDCVDCLEEDISIWRPVCPEGYVSLGDVVVKGPDKPPLDFIRIVKKEYTNEVKYEKSVWNEKGFAKIVYDENNKVLSNKTLNKVSIWPIGYNFLDEERINQRKRDLEYSGGYSLFRASDSYNKPNEKAYLLKPEYIYKVNTPGELGQNTDLGFGWLGGKPREGQYSIYNYLGMTTFGIITNSDTNFSPDGLGKSYYIENVKDNLYGIKALNPATNLFEHYYITNQDKFDFTDTLSRGNPKQHFELVPIRDSKDNIKKKDDLILVHLKNKETGKFFYQNFNSSGLNNETSVEGSSGSIFQFQSYNGDIFN